MKLSWRRCYGDCKNSQQLSAAVLEVCVGGVCSWEGESNTCVVARNSLPHAEEFLQFAKTVERCFNNTVKLDGSSAGCVESTPTSFYCHSHALSHTSTVVRGFQLPVTNSHAAAKMFSAIQRFSGPGALPVQCSDPTAPLPPPPRHYP